MSKHKYSLEHNNILQAFKCVVGNKKATYVSGPITTGPRFIEWYIKTGNLLEADHSTYDFAKKEAVHRKNELDIIRIANRIRKSSVEPVIEPASLHILSWNQLDYYKLWIKIMKQYVNKMIALDGWQYSVGCVIEFHHAIKCGIQVKTIDDKQINEENARRMILEAADDIELRGASFDLLIRMAKKLKSHNLFYGEKSA